jgi:hypothetical protein
MKIWLFLELVLKVLVPLFAITQVVIPTLRKRALFPMFRSKRRRLEQELAELRSGSDDAHLEGEVRKEREKAEREKAGQQNPARKKRK